MKKIQAFLPILFILCSFCKKDSPTEIEQILVDGIWIQSNYLTDDDNDGVFTDASLPCQFGDTWRFMANKKFELRDEIDYCDPDVDSVFTLSGIWELRNNDQELYVEIEPDFLYFNFQIFSINDTLLELRQFNSPSSQAPLEERFVFHR